LSFFVTITKVAYKFYKSGHSKKPSEINTVQVNVVKQKQQQQFTTKNIKMITANQITSGSNKWLKWFGKGCTK